MKQELTIKYINPPDPNEIPRYFTGKSDIKWMTVEEILEQYPLISQEDRNRIINESKSNYRKQPINNSLNPLTK